jgi:hypothetical protein
MVLRALDIVKRCYSDADGQKLHIAILDYIRRGEPIVVSFDGVDVVPSSFVNAAFIVLLDEFDFERIKDLLSFSNTNPQINEMIKKRFMFEVSRKNSSI